MEGRGDVVNGREEAREEADEDGEGLCRDEDAVDVLVWDETAGGLAALGSDRGDGLTRPAENSPETTRRVYPPTVTAFLLECIIARGG